MRIYNRRTRFYYDLPDEDGVSVVQCTNESFFLNKLEENKDGDLDTWALKLCSVLAGSRIGVTPEKRSRSDRRIVKGGGSEVRG
ncbi:hypothetical protein QC764_0075150 [Podospora pseudoanserina]|uniref:Uncharacterized protein n=1 Tax=Podospora pseudoanserina TaxID=2609844 RepID=A0ABR0I4J2_9PEZI|nr:hypothetical protein QC764_0075150 [Podospora pseudoanserina]